MSGGRRDVSNCWARRAIDAASSIDGIRTRLRAALLHRRRGGWRAGSHISMRFVCGSAVVTPGAPPHHPAPRHRRHHHPGSITSSQRGLREEDKPDRRVCRALFALRSCFCGLCKVCKSLRHTFMLRFFFFLFYVASPTINTPKSTVSSSGRVHCHPDRDLRGSLMIQQQLLRCDSTPPTVT